MFFTQRNKSTFYILFLFSSFQRQVMLPLLLRQAPSGTRKKGCGRRSVGEPQGRLWGTPVSQKNEYFSIFTMHFKKEFDVSGRRCLRLLESLNTYERRSDAIDRCLRKMRENRTGSNGGKYNFVWKYGGKLIVSDLLALRGWRDECYEVRPPPRFDSPPLFKMERAATCEFYFF